MTLFTQRMSEELIKETHAYSAPAQFKAHTSDHAGHNLRRKCGRKACLHIFWGGL